MPACPARHHEVDLRRQTVHGKAHGFMDFDRSEDAAVVEHQHDVVGERARSLTSAATTPSTAAGPDRRAATAPAPTLGATARSAAAMLDQNSRVVVGLVERHPCGVAGVCCGTELFGQDPRLAESRRRGHEHERRQVSRSEALDEAGALDDTPALSRGVQLGLDEENVVGFHWGRFVWSGVVGACVSAGAVGVGPVGTVRCRRGHGLSAAPECRVGKQYGQSDLDDNLPGRVAGATRNLASRRHLQRRHPGGGSWRVIW